MQRLITAAAIVLAGGPISAAETPRLPASVHAFLERHCFSCHNDQKQEGDLNLSKLASDFAARESAQLWEAVAKRLDLGEMPPQMKPRPSQTETDAVLKWLGDSLRAATTERQLREGRVLVRRLNRIEYENTLHDLLAIDAPLRELLPEDGVAHGFDKVDAALTLSPVQVEKYLEAADVALDAALGIGPPPKFIQERYPFENIIASWESNTVRRIDGAVVLFNSGYSPTTVKSFRAPAPGEYRVRISAYGFQSSGKPLTMRVYAGTFQVGSKTKLIDYFDLRADEPQVVEFVARIDGRNDTLKIAPYGTIYWQKDGPNYDGPGLAFQWVEIEGPLDAKTWPPASRQRLLGDADLARGTAEDLEKVLRQFAPRAFRQPVSVEAIAPYVDLARGRLSNGASFEEALRAGLKAVLVSPRFLFLDEQPGRLDGYALAARLSYFLWSTMPDEELLNLAAEGKLSGRGGDEERGSKSTSVSPSPPRPLTPSSTLHDQVERMLNDPKSAAFTENFTGQWLGLRNINFTTPDARLYPEFDELLEISMVRETHAYFEEVLRRDSSVLEFIDSDWTMLNERLAKHYGIPGVTGQSLQRVTLRPEWHRGGVLTHASVLKVTANGTTTSPVLRGVWVLDRLLGRPVPPPPANVPAVEPDIRGAKTIRQQIAKHREIESCAVCHANIDPVGFALENYDVIGGWRERYRITPERGSRAEYMTLAVDRRDHRIGIGPTVDPGDRLPDGRSFTNLTELKSLLLTDPDRVARGLTGKLLVYATGHGLETGDFAVVREITDKLRARNYGFRSLVHEVVQSEVFRIK